MRKIFVFLGLKLIEILFFAILPVRIGWFFEPKSNIFWQWWLGVITIVAPFLLLFVILVAAGFVGLLVLWVLSLVSALLCVMINSNWRMASRIINPGKYASNLELIDRLYQVSQNYWDYLYYAF